MNIMGRKRRRRSMSDEINLGSVLILSLSFLCYLIRAAIFCLLWLHAFWTNPKNELVGKNYKTWNVSFTEVRHKYGRLVSFKWWSSPTIHKIVIICFVSACFESWKIQIIFAQCDATGSSCWSIVSEIFPTKIFVWINFTFKMVAMETSSYR